MAHANMPAGAGERLLEELVRHVQSAAPTDLSAVVNRHVQALGMDDARVYLADLQQRRLMPLDERGPAYPGGTRGRFPRGPNRSP
ncbi:hypothetical protein [Streptomyces sp. NPDC048639]|uniref:hypothetical protein n=1 Tax=Streptomyces sp. NPDC048639 TaxID=3365581 RepID=UPI00371F1966